MATLSYITLLVDDVDSVKDWYVRHLGLSVSWESADFVLLAGDGADLGLHHGSPLSEPEKVQLHFSVADVDADYERLTAEGLTFYKRPETKPWGHRTAYLSDPAGHTVELYTPIR